MCMQIAASKNFKMSWYNICLHCLVIFFKERKTDHQLADILIYFNLFYLIFGHILQCLQGPLEE